MGCGYAPHGGAHVRTRAYLHIFKRIGFSWWEPVAYPGGFLVARKPPPTDHDFFYSGGDAVTGTDPHKPFTFATFGNPP